MKSLDDLQDIGSHKGLQLVTHPQLRFCNRAVLGALMATESLNAW
jgi:hypothetical protein